MKRKLVSLDLPVGTNIVVWQGDDETHLNGEIRRITIQLDVPSDEASVIRKKLRALAGRL